MQITDVRIFLRNEPKLKAFVTITLDGVLVIHNAKVIHGQKGLFVAMPSRKGPENQHMDVVHPIDKTFRQELESTVLSAYEMAVKEMPTATSQPVPQSPATPTIPSAD